MFYDKDARCVSNSVVDLLKKSQMLNAPDAGYLSFSWDKLMLAGPDGLSKAGNCWTPLADHQLLLGNCRTPPASHALLSNNPQLPSAGYQLIAHHHPPLSIRSQPLLVNHPLGRSLNPP